MPLSEDTPVLRSDFRLRNVSLKRCIKVRHKSEVIQNSDIYGGKTATCDDLADSSQRCLTLLSSCSSRRNALLQDRPGSGPGKENMNPDDGTVLCFKNLISCDQPSKRLSMRSSMRITCKSRSCLTKALGSQVRPQQRALTSTNIECRRHAVVSLKDFPNQQSPQPSRGTGQTQVRYGPEQVKDDIIPSKRAKARQKKKLLCSRVAHQFTPGLPIPLTPKIFPRLNMPYSSLGLGNCRPWVTVGSCFGIPELLNIDITNSVLDLNRFGRVCTEHCMLRKSQSTMCHNQSCLLLYQRHKDFLEHAALSIHMEPTPRDSLIKTIIRSHGLFINLWTKSYDSFILQAPLKVVIGCKLAEIVILDGVRPQDISMEEKIQANKEIGRCNESSFARNSDIASARKACVAKWS